MSRLFLLSSVVPISDPGAERGVGTAKLDFGSSKSIILGTMVGERNQGGIEVTDRRTSGETFADALLASGQDLSRVPKGDPNLLFERVQCRDSSGDGCHAIAIGQDEERYVLLRDGVPVLEWSQNESIRVDAKNEDFSRMAVSFSGFYTSRNGLYLIDEQGPISLGEGKRMRLIWNSPDLRDFWISSSCWPRGTNFQHVSVDKGLLDNDSFFTVGRTLEDPRLIAANSGAAEILWSGKDNGRKEHVYKNKKRMFGGYNLQVRSNKDGSIAISTVSNSMLSGNFDASIYLNEKRLFKDKFHVYRLEANNDATSAAVEMRYGDDHAKIFFLVGDKFVVSKRVERVKSLMVDSDGRIVAEVVRNKVDRIITVGGSSTNKEDLPSIEDKPAA